MFLVKKYSKEKKMPCIIYYVDIPDEWRKEQKLQWFTVNPLSIIQFEHINPDKNNNWINIADNDFEDLLDWEKIFEVIAPGVNTGRDEWVTDFSKANLNSKCDYFESVYNQSLEQYDPVKGDLNFDLSIKWSETIKGKLKRGLRISKSDVHFNIQAYRPFVKVNFCYSQFFNDRLTEKHFRQWGKIGEVENISFNLVHGTRLDFAILATNVNSNYAFYSLDPNQTVTLYVYDESGQLRYNITDWCLNKFSKYFGKKGVTKESIFYYLYGVLHSPAYRKKYALNLRREFPRIPFYEDFQQWAVWGKALMDLHINYEKVQPFALIRIDIDLTIVNSERLQGLKRAKLKANKTDGTIEVDGLTMLKGIPVLAWDYKLGNRSALEWVLDQYKESKPKDPTIAEKFNTYLFADYKEQAIDLLKRVCTVSVETVKIVNEMALLESKFVKI
jgi:predicted helicase